LAAITSAAHGEAVAVINEETMQIVLDFSVLTQIINLRSNLCVNIGTITILISAVATL